MGASVQQTWESMGQIMKSVSPDTEWIAFAARSDHLLDPDTPLRNPEHINYPGKDDPSVIPVHTGILERKKRFTKSYKEGYFVLTPAGYLHEFDSSDSYTGKRSAPRLSIFLPNCTLGAPSAAHASSNKFHIEPTKKGMGSTAFTIRGRSHDEMYEWWNDIKQLSKVYLTASESMDRSGPVPAAVRSAGYLSEDEEDGGSSVEEEDDEEEEEDEEEDEDDEEVDNAPTSTAQSVHTTHTADTATGRNGAPAYDGPSTASGQEIGSSGYAVEKKESGASGAAGPASAEGVTMHPTGQTQSHS